MAGIGFRLEKILKSDSFSSSIKAHFYSLLIAAGPWFLSIVTVLCLYYFRPANIDTFEHLYFRVSLNYIFAASLITTGMLSLSLSRYISDKLYKEDTDALIPAFNSAAVALLTLQSIIGASFIYFTEGPLTLKFLTVLLYFSISLIWLIFIFLTALHDYLSIAVCYLVGTVISIFAGIKLGLHYDLAGYFAGVLIGQLTVFVLLSARLFIEFPSKRIFDKDLFGFLKNNKILVFTGMFYNIAIWIDKIIFWASPKATAVTGFLRSFHEYEIPIFFAYVTIIPLLSLFLVYVETNFYLRYRTFYDKVLNRGSYAEIGRAKKEVGKSVYDGTKMLVIIQGGLSMLAILYASDIAVMLKLPIIVVPILRISIIGAFLHGMLLTNMIIMLYFDFKVLAFTTTALFMVTNGLFSYLSLSIPLPYLGYNYTAAAFITLIVSFCMVSYKFKKLEYITFALQTLE